MALEEAFMNACIEAKSRDRQYPRRRIGGRIFYAHRLIYEALRGPIPDDLTVDHLCFNRKCINIDHLELVTASENTRRAQARRGHRAGEDPCIRGHLNWRENGRGWQCRDCHREQVASARLLTRAAKRLGA